MAPVVDDYPSSDDDLPMLGDLVKRSAANQRVTSAPKRTILSPEKRDLVPKVKPTPSSRRIRRLRAGKRSLENPLFKSWTAVDNSDFQRSTKKSVSRRPISRPSTEERDEVAELNAANQFPKAPATRPAPESNKGFEGDTSNHCDLSEEISQEIQDQLENDMREPEAPAHTTFPISILESNVSSKSAEESQQESPAQDEGIYIVERITSHQGNGVRRRYLVKWQGYDTAENSWVPRKDFVDKTFPQQYDEQLHSDASNN